MKSQAERLGKRLTRYREAREFSQRKLAARAGLSESYVRLIENGERSPSLDIVRMIAKALDVTPLKLETGSDTITCPHCRRKPNGSST